MNMLVEYEFFCVQLHVQEDHPAFSVHVSEDPQQEGDVHDGVDSVRSMSHLCPLLGVHLRLRAHGTGSSR